MTIFTRFIWRRTPEKIQPIPKAEFDVPVGSLWQMTPEDDDPFPPKKRSPARVLEVRDGWVRYYLNEFFPDNRKKITDFLAIYCRVS